MSKGGRNVLHSDSIWQLFVLGFVGGRILNIEGNVFEADKGARLLEDLVLYTLMWLVGL